VVKLSLPGPPSPVVSPLVQLSWSLRPLGFPHEPPIEIEHRAVAETTAIRQSRPWKLNRWLHLDSTCYGETSEHTSKAHGGRRRCGHGDGPWRWNTGDAVRDETAYQALLASQCGRGGAVGPRRSYCSGVGGTRCELRPAMATAKVPGTAAAAAVAAVSKGEGKAKCGARRLTGARWVLSWRSVARHGLSGQDTGHTRRHVALNF